MNLRALLTTQQSEPENPTAPEPASVPARTPPLSRRRVLAASAGAVLAAGCSANGSQDDDADTGTDPQADHTDGSDSGSESASQEPLGKLGANFNEDPGSVTFDELRGVSASWLRGFVPMPEVTADATRQRAVKMLISAHQQGYGTVLSLKFPFQRRPIPRPGGTDMSTELARVDHVLEAVLDTVDILVVGNEPFIESRPEDLDSGAMNAYYESVAAHVIAFRKKHFPSGCRTRLYMGALNHLDQPEKRTTATSRWLSFARRTAELEGVDIHPHVAAQRDVQAYLDYVLPRLRSGQRFLVTEFSLVNLWKQHLKDTVPARFADRYGLPSTTPVWKVISAAIEHPVPERQWRDFLSMSPWFEDNKHFLRTQTRRFRDTGRLAVATYGVTQGEAMTRDFGPDKQPWLLNSLYANRTVQAPQSGLPAHGYGFFDDFRALQRAQDRLPVHTARVPT